MTTKKSPTGWMAYVAEYKALYPDKKVDYKTLMQEYIKTRGKIDECN